MKMAKKIKATEPEQNVWFDLAVGIVGNPVDGDVSEYAQRAERALRWLAAKKNVDVIAAKEIAAALWG
jgi:hypothetical protein